MRNEETQLEHAMRRALLRELSRYRKIRVAPDRADIIRKVWCIGKSKHQAYMLEGRLEQNVYSGDITIAFRRFQVKLGG